jgi:hypothetical protein
LSAALDSSTFGAVLVMSELNFPGNMIQSLITFADAMTQVASGPNLPITTLELTRPQRLL